MGLNSMVISSSLAQKCWRLVRCLVRGWWMPSDGETSPVFVKPTFKTFAKFSEPREGRLFERKNLLINSEELWHEDGLVHRLSSMPQMDSVPSLEDTLVSEEIGASWRTVRIL